MDRASLIKNVTYKERSPMIPLDSKDLGLQFLLGKQSI